MPGVLPGAGDAVGNRVEHSIALKPVKCSFPGPPFSEFPTQWVQGLAQESAS